VKDPFQSTERFQIVEYFVRNQTPTQLPILHNFSPEKVNDLLTNGFIGSKQLVNNRIGVDHECAKLLKNAANGRLSACYPTCNSYFPQL
jgi:hypothetical protein